MISLSTAPTNYAPFAARHQQSPTTRDAAEERAFIDLVGACERTTIGCIRAHAELVRDERLALIRTAREAKL